MIIRKDENISYYGKDALQIENAEIAKVIKKYLYCDCVTFKGNRGVIIGIEDSNSFLDYYFIVLIPSKKEIEYELVNDSNFIETIQV